MKTLIAFLLIASSVSAQEWVCANGRCTLVRQTIRVTTVRVNERVTYRVFAPRPAVQAATTCNCSMTGVCTCDPAACVCPACRSVQRVRYKFR